MLDGADVLDETENQPPEPEKRSRAEPQGDQDTVEYWKEEVARQKRSYDGMKGHAEKEKTRADRLAAKHEELSEELEALKLDTGGKMTTLTEQLTQTVTAKEQLEVELAGLRKRGEVGKMIRQTYPVLAELFEDNLLIGVEKMEGEALTKFLTQYAERIKSLASNTQQNLMLGTTPPSPPSGDPPATTFAELQKGLSKTYREKGANSPEYKAALDRYTQHIIEHGAK